MSTIFLSIVIEALPFVLLGCLISGALQVFLTPERDIGIAMGSGTDVAIETSDVVLMQSSFGSLVHAYRLAKKTVLNTRENVVIAIGVVLFLLIGLFAGFIYMASGMFVHEKISSV